MIELRDYQEDCLERTRAALAASPSAILEAPTGAGKTAMAAEMLRRAQGRNRRSYFLCHRKELVDQTALTFDQVGLEYGYIAAGFPRNPLAPIQICSVDTLQRRLDIVPPPHFCIWDECHHIAAKGWAKIRETWPDSFHVGLSATPERLDGKGLGEWFSAIVRGPLVVDLIEQGHLAPYDVFTHPEQPDLKGIRTQMGDWAKRQLAEEMSKRQLVGGIVEHWQKLAGGRRTVVFAVNIAHSNAIVEEFVKAGVPAVHLDGDTDKYVRRDALQKFAKGEYSVVSNVNLFGEGFDLAANSGMNVTVDCVVSARPTQSLTLWLQCCGRSLRPKADGSRALILDHAGNALRHGLPIEERDWSLADRTKPRDEPSLKECPVCFMVMMAGARVCPGCEHRFAEAPSAPKEVEHEDGELTALEDKRVDRAEVGRMMGECRSYADFIEVGKRLGYRAGWAKHAWTERQAEERLDTMKALVDYARKRGKRSPELWARVVLSNRRKRRAQKELF